MKKNLDIRVFFILSHFILDFPIHPDFTLMIFNLIDIEYFEKLKYFLVKDLIESEHS